MSKWRQRGFVQDSDEEEEESQIEKIEESFDGGKRVEEICVEKDAAHVERGKCAEGGRNEVQEARKEEKGDLSLDVKFDLGERKASPKSPTVSPITPLAEGLLLRVRNESPDPLQISQRSISEWNGPQFRSSQSLGAPTIVRTTPEGHPRLRGAFLASSQSLGEPVALERSSGLEAQRSEKHPSFAPSLDSTVSQRSSTLRGNARQPPTAASNLEEFGILPLSDSDSNDVLSDPPSDLDAQGMSSTTPHRRTQVQVVIPQSTVTQQGIIDIARAQREFRTRKPIQLHPYAIEGERYRREFQSRGIKPVPRVQSPSRRPGQNAQEIQEQEFNPDTNTPLSPPQREIPVSTPVVQRRKTDHPHKSPRRERGSGSGRHRISASHSQLLNGTKRRRLSRTLHKVTTSAMTTTHHDANPLYDIWSAPESPPYSSSPVISTDSALRRPTLSATTPAIHLPTPSTSSNIQDDAQQSSGSESEPIAQSIHRSGVQRRHFMTISSDDSDDSEAPIGGLEESDTELRRQGKRIKGVLPASWLRFDRQTQKRRKAQATQRERGRTRITVTPDQIEPQRGVAQRITKRAGSPGRTQRLGGLGTDFVVISDESDSEPVIPLRHNADNLEHALEDASNIAAEFDHRYGDEDSDNMENDRLHLFTLSSTGSKRKRQTNLTDAFNKAKKKRKVGSGTSGSNRSNKSHYLSSKRQRHTAKRRVKRIPLPDLSVLDFDQSSSERGGAVPQFLKLARRQAHKRADHGRQSPSNKQIRLHTARDTEDANQTLRQWREGILKPNVNVGQCTQASKERQPLTDRIDNRQLPEEPPTMKKKGDTDMDGPMMVHDNSPMLQRRKNISTGLLLFQRTPTSSMRPPNSTTNQSKPKAKSPYTRQKPLPFRTAQLEGDESQFSRSHRKIAFEKGLQRVDRQFNLPLSINQCIRNPQLARFLSDDDDAGLPLLPSARDIGEDHNEVSSKKPPAPKRLVRKAKAQRIDVDTREYRQPSEPAIQELFNDVTVDHAQEQAAQQELGQPILQGLGVSGTRYPTSFDISPLKVGTYFQSSTFIGSEDFRRALQTGQTNTRSLDDPVGYCNIHYSSKTVRCGPWDDETYSRIAEVMNFILRQLSNSNVSGDDFVITHITALGDTSKFLRSMINYCSTRLSFLDTVDRREFTIRMKELVQSLLDKVLDIQISTPERSGPRSIHTMAYLLVLSMQIHRIAEHPVIDSSVKMELTDLIKSISKVIVTYLVHQGRSELSSFLERNKRYKERENGIQHEDILVESVVICMHVLDSANIPKLSFWEAVSQELSPQAKKAIHLKDFESVWATLFTLLPYFELDVSGILVVNRRSTFQGDNWVSLRDLLKRLFELYPNTYRSHSSSLNDYIRANLQRCHVLIDFWGWKRCDPVVITMFDFFAKNNFRHLKREQSGGSIRFLENLAGHPSLAIEPNDNSFQTFLKCLALGLQGMKSSYIEKKIRSFIFRLTPNHGRSYPKDQPLSEDDLIALRNHHDLLCTLYWASPPSCRPKLDLLRGLVQHESSHREACRVNVRAWANLTTFQLSTNEPYMAMHPFAQWHRDIMQQTLRQYQIAKTEAEDYLQSGALDGTSDISAVMVRQTIERNQEQVIATLRDCIEGMRAALKHSICQSSLKNFLIDSGIVQLLELPHFEDHRLLVVIRDTLAILRDYAYLQKSLSNQEASQQSSDESQDYGDFPDLDDFDEIEPQTSPLASKKPTLDFIQIPLWHLLSNAFGAERAPDDSLLMDCVDTWVLIASCQVSSNERSWSHYIDPFSAVSYHQLRNTEQTRKFSPYFMACLLECDASVYEEHRSEFLTLLLRSLAERESVLRFQWRLLRAIARVDGDNQLMRNLPFFRNKKTGELDITPDTLRSRRLALISSILANMRDGYHRTILEDPTRTSEAKRTYEAILKDFMAAMMHNYQQLRQGSTVTGAYVEFVQRIVQFLEQYTSDICKVLPFFTDNAAFPLPATDPTYVIGRLCGYAPKLSTPGKSKELSVFVQMVVQRAAADSQQAYLVDQLKTALCTGEAPSADRFALRSVILQGIFPVYVESAFASVIGFTLAKPILQSLKPILENMLFDLRISQASNVESIVEALISIAHTFIRSTEIFKGSPRALKQPHVLQATTMMLEAMISANSLVDYIVGSTAITSNKPDFIDYIDQINLFLVELIHDIMPSNIPIYNGSPHQTHPQYAELLSFCRKGVHESIKANWTESHGGVFFGQGHAKKEVVVDLGNMDEERLNLMIAIQAFNDATVGVYGNNFGYGEDRGSITEDIFV